MTSDLGDLPEFDIDGVVHDLAIDAAGVGIYDWNVVTDELRWDDRLLEIFGTDRESFGGTIEAFNAFVHPEDLPRVSHEIERALAACDEFLLEYRVPLRDGTVRWV